MMSGRITLLNMTRPAWLRAEAVPTEEIEQADLIAALARERAGVGPDDPPRLVAEVLLVRCRGLGFTAAEWETTATAFQGRVRGTPPRRAV